MTTLRAGARMLFVNLPVRDLRRSVAFFTELGFTFDERFSDEKATCMVLSDHAFVMLLVRRFFAGFTTKQVADPETHTGAILAVSARSRQDVDTLVDRALELGGTVAEEPQDQGYMYGRSFYDLDGQAWEVIWMQPDAVG
jgi:predicted lactoylglutathione lyase